MSKTKVSYFKNVSDTSPKTIKLEDWLKNTIDPPKDLKQKVLKYRFLKTKSLKKQIPCITVSARLKKHRDLENIKSKTGFICLDIDPKENPVIDFRLVKLLFTKHPSCYYVGQSVSGIGVYAIIKIDTSKELIKYFKHFKKSLKNIGIIIDESCKDYTRLRFFSYDPEAYFNPKAKTFNIPKKNKVKYKSSTASKSDKDKVEAIISLIESNNIDVTQDYNDWVKAGGALYNSFGGSALGYFHRISRFHPDYNKRKTDSKFKNCMKLNKVTLGSFFNIATKYGIRY